MKFAMLRASQKKTVVKYNNQIAKNDDYYEDVSTSSDYWTVFASMLLTRGCYDEAELWYQEDKDHETGAFKHTTGLKELFWPKGYTSFDRGSVPDVLFVRGNIPDYSSVIEMCRESFKIYYPSGPYYCPDTRFNWDLCFVEDPRHIQKVKEKTGTEVELFKKSCVGKYFRYKEEKKWDICFVCCAPIAERKRLMFLQRILNTLKGKVSAVVIGLKDTSFHTHFRGLPVTFTGWIPRKKIGKIMAQCRIGVVLSDMERDGCPRVIQEFLASGLPVAVSNVTCCSTIYINRKTGIVARDKLMAAEIMDLLAISPLMDTNEFYRTSLSMGCSVQHFIENIKKHEGPVKCRKS